MADSPVLKTRSRNVHHGIGPENVKNASFWGGYTSHFEVKNHDFEVENPGKMPLMVAKPSKWVKKV